MEAAHIAMNDTKELVVYALFKGICTTFALLTDARVDGIMLGLDSKLVLIKASMILQFINIKPRANAYDKISLSWLILNH